MRTGLLASALALAPGVAGAQQCAAPAEALVGVSPLGAPAALPAPSNPRLPREQIEATPALWALRALRALAARGAELIDLGVRHGLRGVFARR